MSIAERDEKTINRRENSLEHSRLFKHSKKPVAKKLSDSINSFCLEGIKADRRNVKKSARVACCANFALT